MLCYTLTCRVCHLAGEFAKLLMKHIDEDRSNFNGNIPGVENAEDYHFKPEEVLCAKIAGLCHDLGALFIIIAHA